MPCLHRFFEVAVGRRDDPHVDADVARAADALERLLLEEAQQLGLQRRRHLADLVEEHRAAVGRARAGPRFCCRASVNAPRSWPNSSLSSSVSGSAEQVMFMNGRCRAIAVVVDHLGGEVLAGAALAGQQHRGRRARRDLRAAAT